MDTTAVFREEIVVQYFRYSLQQIGVQALFLKQFVNVFPRAAQGISQGRNADIALLYNFPYLLAYMHNFARRLHDTRKKGATLLHLITI